MNHDFGIYRVRPVPPWGWIVWTRSGTVYWYELDHDRIAIYPALADVLVRMNARRAREPVLDHIKLRPAPWPGKAPDPLDLCRRCGLVH